MAGRRRACGFGCNRLVAARRTAGAVPSLAATGRAALLRALAHLLARGWRAVRPHPLRKQCCWPALPFARRMAARPGCDRRDRWCCGWC
eukprot:5209715-Prymnesium_polylepis.2